MKKKILAALIALVAVSLMATAPGMAATSVMTGLTSKADLQAKTLDLTLTVEVEDDVDHYGLGKCYGSEMCKTMPLYSPVADIVATGAPSYVYKDADVASQTYYRYEVMAFGPVGCEMAYDCAYLGKIDHEVTTPKFCGTLVTGAPGAALPVTVMTVSAMFGLIAVLKRKTRMNG